MTTEATLFGRTTPAAPQPAFRQPDDGVAQRMFDGRPVSARTATPPEQQANQDLADRLYGEQSDEPVERGNDGEERPAEERMFAGPVDVGECRRHIAESLALVHADLPMTERQGLVVGLVHELADLGLEATEVAAVARSATDLLQEARAGRLDPSVQQSWAKQNAATLAGYGFRTSAVVAEARSMIARQPELRDLLERGLADHPLAFKTMLQAADRRLRGRK